VLAATQNPHFTGKEHTQPETLALSGLLQYTTFISPLYGILTDWRFFVFVQPAPDGVIVAVRPGGGRSRTRRAEGCQI
jgi:hypothetical protein